MPMLYLTRAEINLLLDGLNHLPSSPMCDQLKERLRAAICTDAGTAETTAKPPTSGLQATPTPFSGGNGSLTGNYGK